MKTIILLCGVLVIAAAHGAETPGDTNAAPATKNPEAALSSKAAAAAWTKLGEALDAVQSRDDEGPDTQKAVRDLMNEARDYATKFPDDAHALNALMLWAQLGQMMSGHGWEGAPKAADVDATFNRLASDPSVPKPKRAEIRAMQIEQAIHQAAESSGPAAWDAIEPMFSNFDKQFGPKFSFDGQEAVAAALRKEELMALSQTGNTPRLQALLKKLAASSNPEVAEIADEYRQMQERVAALKSKPMDLKFTAVDGTTVDVSKLRGKVVLVDFWATWCGPCVEEVPEIVDIYQKYHAKGFEVVGISLDQDKDTMLAFTKEHGMTWPQYFDGEGWDNKISKSFGIGAIPAMWLLDKKGMLSATDDAMNGSDLADQVEKLLAAP